MRHRSSNGSVIVALGASALVHMLVIVPLLMAMFASGGASPRVEAMFSSEALKHEEEDQRHEEPEPVLGIEKSNASTLTWVGYEEYLEHIARLSEIEQAAFTDAPTGTAAMPEEAQPIEEVVEAEPLETAEPVEVVEQPVEERIEEVVAAEVTEPIEPGPAPELPARLPEIDLTRIARALDELIGWMAREPDEGEAEERVEVGEEREEPTEATEPERVAAAESTEPVEPRDAAQPAQPATESQPTKPEAPGEPADSADKQSEPTSIIEVTQQNWRLGRPLAAQGVELKPQRPHFSIMQRLTASPCNPLVEIHFNRSGAATKVAIRQSSRDDSINAAIEASAYRWRAEGEAIDRLRGEQTFAVRIRFILNPYARCP